MRILAEIINWIKTRPYWEQFAFTKIISGTEIVESDYYQIFQYFLEDNGLESKKEIRPTLWSSDNSYPTDETSKDKFILKSISNLQNVNALVPNQKLEFDPQLTVIYGDNASGKSGYSRVLGNAGFTRARSEILPDVTKPLSSSDTITAKIEIDIGNETKTLKYNAKDILSELSSVYVFDNDSSYIHLKGENEMSFVPNSLANLTKLAELIDYIKKIFSDHINNKTKINKFIEIFEGDSTIKPLIVNLNSESDFEYLTELATLNGKEEEEIAALDTKIAEQILLKIPEKISELNGLKNELQIINQELDSMSLHLNSDKVEQIISHIRLYKEILELSKKVGLDQFRNENLKTIGTDQWVEFIKEAKKLASEEDNITSSEYPKSGDICLLCHQPLSQDAIVLLKKLWKYLENEVAIQLKKAKENLESDLTTINNIKLDILKDETRFRLSNYDIELQKLILSVIEAYRVRKELLIKCINELDFKKVPSFLKSPTIEIQNSITSIDLEIGRLNNQDSSEEISNLKMQKNSINHKILLNKYLTEIGEYIRNSSWIAQAKRSILSTRHVTEKYDSLFDKLITEQFQAKFQENLDNLGCPFKIIPITYADKGKKIKYLQLKLDDSQNNTKISIERVLSDGEKKAVALCDFLSESTIENNCSCIVLDDPVTSLDLNWRDKIAKILVELSKSRQVIIFTHDVTFWYMLHSESTNLQVSMRSHIIERGMIDNQKPGNIYLDNNPESNNEYENSNNAKKHLANAKKSEPEKRNAEIKSGFDALRRGYEVIIEKKILKDAIKRWKPNISVERLSDVIWDQTLVNEIINKHREISRYIGPHSQPDDSPFQKPSTDLLNKEIGEFDQIKGRISQLKKPVDKNI